jgi:hypothetical protein
MLMENTAQFENSKKLLSIFDLKGSLVDRKEKGIVKPTTTLKDQNFIIYSEIHERQKKDDSTFINLKREVQVRLMNFIRKDLDFLKCQNLMDYSLLICIEEVSKKSQDEEDFSSARYSV